MLNESLANKGTVYNVESNSLADNIQIRERSASKWIVHLMNVIGFDYITDVTDTIGRDKYIRIKMKDLALLYYIFPRLLFYARFGMAIFITLCLSIIANTIETIENNTADTNIKLNDAADGKYCAIP